MERLESTETEIQGLTMKLTGKIDSKGTPILTQIKSYNAEVIVIPADFVDYNDKNLLPMLMKRLNGKLMKHNNG